MLSIKPITLTLLAFLVGAVPTFSVCQDDHKAPSFCSITAEPHPNAGCGLSTLAWLWQQAESNPTLAKILGAAAGCLLATNIVKNPPGTAKGALAACAVSAGAWTLYSYLNKPLHSWWTFKDETTDGIEIIPSELIFPEDFDFGSGTSASQIEGVTPECGGPDTSTYSPEYREERLQELRDTIKKAIKENRPQVAQAAEKELKALEEYFAATYEEEIGTACEQWIRYKEDIKLMAEHGLNAYRFSIERWKVELQKGVFNQAALDHYAAMVRTCLEHNIQPVIGMHHYTDPAWFLKDGGFENRDNLDGFATYCQKVAQAVYSVCKDMPEKKRFWPLLYTYNSSNAYAVNGYYNGTRPPYVHDMQRSQQVLMNMLDAHVRAYKAIKAVAPALQVGTTINSYELEPVNYYNPAERIKCAIGNTIAQDAVYKFFKDGKYACWIPFMAQAQYENSQAPASVDWIGLNYYSTGYMPLAGKPYADPKRPQTHNPLYSINPEGLYTALYALNDAANSKEAIAARNGKRIPILVTETGIGVGDDHAKRKMLLERYLYAISKAYQNGIPVKGVMIWSFADNWEWGHYRSKYGLFDVNRETQERTWREGSNVYEQIIQEHQVGPDPLAQ